MMAGSASAAAGRGGQKRTYKPVAKLEVFYTGGRVALSQDGTFVVCPCAEEVKVVEVATGSVLQTFSGDTELVTAVAVGPDGKQVYSSSRSLQTKWWDRESGDLKRSWKAHDGPVSDLAVDASGGLLATASADRSVRVWDIERGYCTHSFKGHGGVVTRVLFHPDPHRLQLFSAGDDATVRVWDLVTKRSAAVLSKHFSAVTGLALAADGWTLLSAGRDKVVHVWNLRDYSLQSTVPVYEALEAVCVVPPGSNLPGAPAAAARKNGGKVVVFLTAGERGSLRIWNAESGSCLYEQRLEGAAVPNKKGSGEEEEEEVGAALRLVDATTSSGENALMAVTGDQRLLFYRPTLKEESGGQQLEVAKELVGYNDEVTDLRLVGPEGKLLAVATNSEQVRVYDLESMGCVRSLVGHTDIVLALDTRAGPSGELLLASAGKDHTVRLWEVGSGRCLATAAGHTAAVGALAFSRTTPNFLLSGSSDRTVKVWSLERLWGGAQEEGGPVRLRSQAVVVAHEKDINSLAVAPNDSLAATGSQDRTAKVWRLPELAPLLTLRGHKRGVWCVEFSPVDQALLTASGDKTVRIWSLADGACLKTLEGHTASVLRASFLTRGTQVVSSGADGLLKLWTIRSSECVNTFDAHSDKVWALAVGPGEGRLVTGGADSLLNVWQDTTALDEEEAAAKEEEAVLKEQDLENAVADTDYARALQLAFELRRPFRMLSVFTDLLKDPAAAHAMDALLRPLDKEHLKVLLLYIREWNANARHCHTAQAVLAGILRSTPPALLAQVPQVRELVEGLVPYTQRHFSRMDRLVRSTFLLDYTLSSMAVLSPTEDALEEDKVAFTRVATADAAAPQPRQEATPEPRSPDIQERREDTALSDAERDPVAEEAEAQAGPAPAAVRAPQDGSEMKVEGEVKKKRRKQSKDFLEKVTQTMAKMNGVDLDGRIDKKTRKKPKKGA